ncbi:hypothetical protein EV363DRAFT_1230838, partial [Boletus edulis]
MQYINPSTTRATVCKIFQRANRHLPRVLISMTTPSIIKVGLVMEINPEMLDTTLQQYKQRKIDEQQHAVDRYEQWQKVRKKAMQNAGGKLPKGFREFERLPPPPFVGDDSELSLELNAVSIDNEMLAELDE